jgi:Uncharacterized conserved protein
MPPGGAVRQGWIGSVCGRVNLEGPPLAEALSPFLGAEGPWRRTYETPRINVAPQAQVPVLHLSAGAMALKSLRWWFAPGPQGGRLRTFNARSEGALTSPLYGPWLRSHRCVFPVSSFLEWRQQPDGQRQPYVLRPEAGAALFLAGVWQPAKTVPGASREAAPSGATREAGTFAVLTCAARPSLAWLHHREPRLLTEAGVEAWLGDLTPRQLERGLLGGQAPVALDAYPVARAVGDARQQAPECLAPCGPRWRFGDPPPVLPERPQGTLF